MRVCCVHFQTLASNAPDRNLSHQGRHAGTMKMVIFFPASLGEKTQEAGESRNSWISPCLCNPPAFQKQRPHSIKLHKAACASRPQSVFWPPKTHRTQNPSMATLGELNHPQLLHNWTPLGSVSECRSYSFDGEPV